MKTQSPNKRKDALLGILGMLVVFSIAIIFFTSPVKADPAGAALSNNVTATAANYAAGNRTDAGGTITTMILTTLQQNDKWKAYIGNVSGSLTLDDANGDTIFSWALGAAEVSGELYVSRASNVGWSTINCSNATHVADEETFLGFSSTSVDSINRTFNYTTHAPVTVAGRTITQNTCKSTSTYVSDAVQSIASADFPEVLLSAESDMVFMTPLNQGSVSYSNSQVDFQIIVPDDVTIASTTYYFYVELGS